MRHISCVGMPTFPFCFPSVSLNNGCKHFSNMHGVRVIVGKHNNNPPTNHPFSRSTNPLPNKQPVLRLQSCDLGVRQGVQGGACYFLGWMQIFCECVFACAAVGICVCLCVQLLAYMCVCVCGCWRMCVFVCGAVGTCVCRMSVHDVVRHSLVSRVSSISSIYRSSTYEDPQILHVRSCRECPTHPQ